MKKILNLLFVSIILSLTATSCLRYGIEDLGNSSNKDMAAIDYTYRFLYNDTIKKGTPNEEIQEGRVCEVVFNKKTTKITQSDVPGFQTTLTYDINGVRKAGSTGSVTKNQLYAQFQKLIQQDGLNKLWVSATISDVATLAPLNDSPKLGAPGDFSKDRSYRVTAADGSHQDYIIKTVKGF